MYFLNAIRLIVMSYRKTMNENYHCVPIEEDFTVPIEEEFIYVHWNLLNLIALIFNGFLKKEFVVLIHLFKIVIFKPFCTK